MLRFKKILIDKRGKQIATKGKGRIMHLGSFLSKKGKPVEIVDAPKNKDGSFDRSNWNKTTGEIKVVISSQDLHWLANFALRLPSKLS